jgi:hypothetical protein
MAESLKENLVDLLAGMPKEISIPSGEDTSGENLKHKLGRGDSANYSDIHKRVQFALDQNQDNVIGIADYDGSTVNSYKNDESAGPFVFHKRPGLTHHGGPHSSKHSVSESSSNSSGFTPVPQQCELFLNDTSEEHYNGNWVYINLAQLQSSEDVCG